MIRILTTLLIALPLFGQAKLNINLDHLKAKADKTVNVSLEGDMLRQGLGVMGAEAGPAAGLTGLTGVYIRSYEFSSAGGYTDADVLAIRKQITGPNWVQFVEVSEKGGDQVNISAYMEGGKQAGMVILAAEPKEFTVVNIVGAIDFSKLAEMHKILPHLKHLEGKASTPKPAPAPKAAPAPKKKEDEV